MKPLKTTSIVSIIVPTHNEVDNVAMLYDRIKASFDKIPQYEWELIFIDDSSDETPNKLASLASMDRRVKLIRLVRSFGQAAAIAAGLKRAIGDAAIMMDADLQDPPEAISELLEKWEDGNKVVYGERPSDSKFSLYKILAWLFYRILRRISSTPIPVDAGEFRLLDRVVVDFINGLRERSRFMRGLTVWPGYKSTKIKIKRSVRCTGTTNYNFIKSLSVAADGFISFSVLPLRLATILGIVSASISLLFIVIYMLLWASGYSVFGKGWMSLFISMMFLGGVNLFCIGILGEYVGRIFEEVKRRPLYIIDYEVGFNGKTLHD